MVYISNMHVIIYWENKSLEQGFSKRKFLTHMTFKKIGPPSQTEENTTVKVKHYKHAELVAGGVRSKPTEQSITLQRGQIGLYKICHKMLNIT